MNKPIRTVSLFCLGLILALMVNATYLQFWKAESLNDDPRNRRVLEAAYASERGDILVGKRQTIAESVPSDDEYQNQRVYKDGPLWAPVTGFFTFGNTTGIERSQNDVLTGDDPRLFVRNLIDLVSNEPKRGGNVQLTLDPDAQKAAFDALQALGPEVEGSVVAIQPKTGKVLAMVSLPTYNPNNLASHDFDAVDDLYQRLDKLDSEPLLNRAIQQRLFPGSTFKVVTAAAAIESGRYDKVDAQVPGGATFQLPQTSGESGVIDNEGRDCGSGQISFEQAMGNSCNTTFAQLALEVGAEDMLRQAEAFGFNSDYLDDLGPQVRSEFPADLDPPSLGQSGFGQRDVQATPLQMAMVAAAIANEGIVMKPYLVDSVQSADYDGGEKTDPEEFRRAIEPETADILTELLVSTVDDGTASPAAIPDVEVAGKTGTAQRGVSGKAPYAWFISFAPSEDAEVAVAVMIEEAPGQEIAGGGLGGPIAKAVMEAIVK